MTGSIVATAENLVRAGNPAQAEAVLVATAAQGPLPPDGAAMLARLLHNRAVAATSGDDVPVAVDCLCRALALDPELAASRDALASMAGLAGRLHLDSLRLAPTEPVLAARLALAAWDLDPAGDGHYATTRSLFVHLGTGELGPAVPAGDFDALLRANPADLVALIGLSNLERRAGRLLRAERLLRAAAAVRPQPFAPQRLAALLTELGRTTEADGLFQAVGRPHGGVESVVRLDPAFLAALSAPPAPAPDIELPAGTEFVVFAGCDGGYFRRFSDAFVNSLALTGAKAAVHFHIVDLDDAAREQLERLRRRHPRLAIQATAEAIPATLAADSHRTFYACARFLQLPGLLRAYGVPVLMLDIDLVLLRDVRPLLAQLRTEGADVALTHGVPHDPWCRLWADAVLCAASPAAIAAFDAVRAYILHFLGRGAAIWFLDQVALYAALGSRFRADPAPRVLPWPMDVQNGDGAACYFWSLHSSQPSNQGSEDSELYRRFAEAAQP